MIESYEKFTEICDTTFCPRKVEYNEKTCLRESKRKKCWQKYNKLNEKREQGKKERTEKQSKWQSIVLDVMKRDCRVKDITKAEWYDFCVFYYLFNHIEKEKFLQSIKPEKKFILNEIDPVHIENRSQNKSSEYDTDNIIAGNRIAHERYDSYQSPITGKNIGADGRLVWQEKLKNYTSQFD